MEVDVVIRIHNNCNGINSTFLRHTLMSSWWQFLRLRQDAVWYSVQFVTDGETE